MNSPENEILTGNCLDTLAQLPAGHADLVIADPPYNLGKDFGNGNDQYEAEKFLEFTRQWTHECWRVLKPSGSIYVFMGVQFISHLFQILNQHGFRFNSWIAWHYTQGIGKTRGFSPRHDDILFFTKGKDFTFNLDAVRVPQKFYRKINNMKGANPGDVWTFSHVHFCAAERLPHPTQKPEKLIERMVLASSNPGDLVVDPFLGSGTSAAVAKKLGRRYVGIEIDDKFSKMAAERLERVQNVHEDLLQTYSAPDHRPEETKRLAAVALDEFNTKNGNEFKLAYD